LGQNHIDTTTVLSKSGHSIYIDLNGIENRSIIKHPYPTGVKKGEILIVEIRVVSKEKGNT
jgi:hypothetical protein